MNRTLVIFVSGIAICAGFAVARAVPQGAGSRTTLTGQAAFATAELEKPGIYRHITVADLPAPFATPSATNQSSVVPRPANAWPQAPPGFKVDLFATGFAVPRELRTAPNGDIFLADSGPGEIKVLHGLTSDGKAESVTVFATGLHRPFGIAFYPPGPNPQYVYVGNTNSVVRFPSPTAI
jgi:glucose/arabinose dehydrogenase